MKSFIAEKIAREQEREQRYKEKIQKKKLAEFIKKYCSVCKNKDTQLCHIIKDINNNFSCPFKNI